ncbi:MAG: alpha/beta fold hydrolase [Gemmatimonadales bacterium]
MSSSPGRVPPPRSSGFTVTTDVPLFWCAYGTPGAPRLLVLHGGPGADHEYLLPQFLDLADKHELIFYDQRGGGRSRNDAREPITWQTQVSDLERVVRELVDGAPTIVGYSWGAMLALLYAIDAAKGRVAPPPERLALVDPAALTRAFRTEFEAEFARRQRSPEVERLRAELVASGVREMDRDAYRQRAFELSVAGYFADPRAAANLTAFRVTGRVQQSIWESLGDYDLIRDLGSVRCPTLIVHGRQDPIPYASSEAAARAMGATLVPLDACGHVPYVERRRELFDILHAFLERPSKPDA